MAQIQTDLSQRIRSLERELHTALEEKERAFRYHIDHGKAKIEEGVLAEHRKLKTWLPSYIRHSRFLVIVTAPLIYVGSFRSACWISSWRSFKATASQSTVFQK